MAFTVRMLESADSIEELTELLHRAYKRLGEAGMNYTAVDQSVETTHYRLKRGACFVAVAEGRMIGTIKLNPSDPNDDVLELRDPDMAGISQFGVDPDWSGFGVGRALHERAEQLARTWGAKGLILDTADCADGLIRLYESWGYTVVGSHQWNGKTYASVVMRKPLD